MNTLASRIEESTKAPGRFRLEILSATGEKLFLHFTKIVRVSATDLDLYDGLQDKLYIELPPENATSFWDEMKSIGVPIFAASSSVATDGFFTGTVTTKTRVGMKVRIKTDCVEGKLHMGNEFLIASEPRELCGTEVVALNNLDGSRFSAGYDLSMLEITDLGVAA